MRSGGSRSWRNNNPGNIRPGAFADAHGSVGEAGGFAVFPNETSGQKAIVTLLGTGGYQAQTVEGAIARYAPPTENNTPSYSRFVQQATGLGASTPMKSLSANQLNAVANAIRTIEGWTRGRVGYILP